MSREMAVVTFEIVSLSSRIDGVFPMLLGVGCSFTRFRNFWDQRSYKIRGTFSITMMGKSSCISHTHNDQSYLSPTYCSYLINITLRCASPRGREDDVA